MLDTPNPLSLSRAKRVQNIQCQRKEVGKPLYERRWWALRDSNPQPTAYEAVALTDCAKGPEIIEE